jgi:exodeoxyribonuclease VII small subunit
MENMTYEEALKEINEIAKALENEVIGMDDLEKKVARASELIQYCQVKLRGIKENIDQIINP